MFSYFEANFIENFSWESGISNLGHVTFLQNENRYFVHHFEMVNPFFF